MKTSTFRAVVYIVFSSLVLVAGVVLLLLQWALRAEFSLYAKPYRLYAQPADGKIVGGVSTLWLMLASAGAGVLMVLMIRLLIRGIRELLAARRVRAVRDAAEAAEQARLNPPPPAPSQAQQPPAGQD